LCWHLLWTKLINLLHVNQQPVATDSLLYISVYRFSVIQSFYFKVPNRTL
jgi:hypothetical protein